MGYSIRVIAKWLEIHCVTNHAEWIEIRELQQELQSIELDKVY